MDRDIMTIPIRPAPTILLIHNGSGDVDVHVRHLTAAGLDVSKAECSDAIAVAISVRPDIIILDFGCDGETMALLKREPTTAGIPVIALAALT
jgi:DNA-binding response OmpR family regulator